MQTSYYPMVLAEFVGLAGLRKVATIAAISPLPTLLLLDSRRRQKRNMAPRIGPKSSVSTILLDPESGLYQQ
jgi:hypothetical protein